MTTYEIVLLSLEGVRSLDVVPAETEAEALSLYYALYPHASLVPLGEASFRAIPHDLYVDTRGDENELLDLLLAA